MHCALGLCRAIQVLETKPGHRTVGRAFRHLLRHTLGTERVDLPDGAQDDWNTMPLQTLLPMMCEESEQFRAALHGMVQESGLRHAPAFQPTPHSFQQLHALR